MKYPSIGSLRDGSTPAEAPSFIQSIATLGWMEALSPRAMWFLGLDLGALTGLVALVLSIRWVFGPESLAATLVLVAFELRRGFGKGPSHREKFERGLAQGYAVPVSIAVFAIAAAAVYIVLRPH